MLGNYFKVVEDFVASPCEDKDASTKGSNELLSVEKGEIIVDVQNCDDDWVTGKALVSQKFGKIPRKCIEMLTENDGGENVEKMPEDAERKRCSRDSMKRSSSGEVMPKEEVNDDAKKDKTSKPPQAPPRLRKSREVTEKDGSFRSRGSDEGYNSSSHYSGEKASTSEPVVSTTGYCNAYTNDAPLLSSFKESPSKFTSPRPSITDAEGYEIPIFTPRSSVNGEIATGEEKGVTLKFIFNRKSTAFDEKSPEKFPLQPRKASLNAIGENSEPIYETWSTDPNAVSPSDSRKSKRREKILITLFVAVSLLISLGIFFLLVFVAHITPLLCFTVSVNIFAIFLTGLLTVQNKRWLCIASLLVPSLFSRKVKIGICMTLCILIIAAPVCNVSSNIELVLRCKRLSVDKSAARNATMNAETVKVMMSYGGTVPATKQMPGKSRIVNPTSLVNKTAPTQTVQVKNNLSNVSEKCKNNFQDIKQRCLKHEKNLHQRCIKASNAAISSSLDSSCSVEDNSCVVMMLEPLIQNACKNLTVAKLEKPRVKTERARVEEKESLDTFRDTLLQLLPLLLLLVLHEAYQYNRDYLSNKEIDNVYITGKLKALDCERKERGMRNKLFPLRKLEFRTYVLPSFFLQTSQETKEVLRWLIVWLVLGIGVLFAVLLDKYVYSALVFLYEDAKSYSSCHIKFTEINVSAIYSMCFILAFLLIAAIIQSYILRARSRICAFFYPKKESARGVYLYYKILHERSRFWKACRERGCTLSEARRIRWKIGIGHRIFRSLPASMRDAMEKLFVYRCMICDSLTCRKSFVCKDEECFATFCYECYIDMGQSCISCRPNGTRDSVFASV